ncbi:Endophilin-B1 [Merluccius polli]|uniref:Endophilin-B1 n=1 Tax=Merluccius polli TaxID=89951 RepID=A0AA47NM32_MERPO|nr:Endophilin-B1 [Merluccius polli]
MDITRLAVDAGQFINRAVQYTGETLGQAECTQLDSSLEGLLARVETTKTWTDLGRGPDGADRLEDHLYERLDWSAPPRPRAQELLGDTMTQAGSEVGPHTPYGTSLVRCGEAQKQMGEAERKFVQSCHIHFLSPLRSFTEGEYRAMQDERRALVNKRLDLDIAKTRLRKAHEAEAEARNLNSNPLGDDYISHVSFMFSFLRVKWLKMWAQEISQAEMELRICQSLFDRQAEMTRQLLEGIGTTHMHHLRSLADFVEAQATYYAQCHQHAQDMRGELASIPALLCSNNWQAATSNSTKRPSTDDDDDDDFTSEPPGLKQAVVIHRLPDFSQDLAGGDPPRSAPEEAAFGPSVAEPSSQPQTNNNNNNNNSKSSLMLTPTAESQAANGLSGVSSAAKDSSGAAAEQRPPVPNCPALGESAAPRSVLKRENAVETLTAGEEMASQSLTTSGGAGEPQTANEFSTVLLTTSDRH